MAFNKQQTSMVTKAVIVVVILAFVLSIGGIFTQLGSFSGPQNTSTQTQTVQQKLDAITAQYQPAVTANEQALKTKPKDYEILKALAIGYYDWAAAMRQAVPTANTAPMWQRSADYYKQAVAVKAGDPNVETDYAIATFYGGDQKGAIKIIEGVMKADPKFAPAPFNAGIFYATTGDNTKAAAAWNTYLALEPNGQNAANAKQFLSQLKATSTQSQASTATTGN